MTWYQDYNFILRQFECGDERVDETKFYFKTDPQEIEHFIGFLPQYEEPFWAGCCDIPDGCSFKTATELFEAKIYDGRSIKDRWDELVLVSIGGVNIDDWAESSFKY